MTHPAVRDLFQTLSRHPAFQDLLARLVRRENGPFALSGLTPAAKALYVALVWQATERPLLVVTETNQSAENLAELTQTFFALLIGKQEGSRPQLLPALDVLPGQKLSPHSEIAEQRGIGMWRLASGGAPITIAPAASALFRTRDAAYYRQLALDLRTGDELPLETIEGHLQSIGYERRDPVEMVGEYSIRGGILDVFGAESARPLRIEFFGDEIESIRRFEVESQRSVMKISEARILPLAEQARSRQLLHAIAGKLDYQGVASPGDPFPGWEFAAALAEPRKHCVLDLAPDAVVVLDEPESLRAAGERLWKRLEAQRSEPDLDPDLASANFLEWPAFEALLSSRARLEARELDLNSSHPHIATRPSLAFHGNMQVAVAEARTMVEQGYRVAFFAPTNGELERLADILREYSVPFQLGLAPDEAASPYLAERAYLAGPVAHTYLIKGLVRRGVTFPESSIAFIGSEDLFDASELAPRPAGAAPRISAFASDIADLKPGDYVVHVTHGVGRFLGLRELAQGEGKGDFMLLEYAGEAKLYVPLTRMDLVEKYRGAGEAAPPLDKLGGSTWTARKNRVKAKMRDMADELLKLYAERRMAEGFAFSPDSNWQREFEDAFEYAETKDQLTAAREIKRDLESPHPMDRLLCGDVGFGKTEVAMRAAFKALGDGKQVAVLAPTTVLAFQHYETFRRRFAAFPVRVEMFSRLRPSKELKSALEEVAAGKVDVAIGTHRLLSKDVEFRDLGLLIVDEEQRFGVRHKERLKQMRKNVHVLAMSATPIPRTLHMSLLGIRDMSVIETPPKDRLAIHTVVAHYDPELIRTAIEQELSRGGQVYFVHNRIDSIFARAASIQDLIPGVRIGVGHGQMDEKELERALLGFMRHDYDVFVCTTIVENGLDIPLANTMIIENAERYGLSELYQLRGRVGRSNRRAYAYLLVPPDAELSEIARKRLAALREFSDLGAGFKIAALDLELRGAGNLLGGEQHGHIAAVGFDTYVRLLEETVQELKGEERPVEVHSTLNLGLDVRIPPEYIGDEQQRLRAYKRVADVQDAEQAGQVRSELADRYGPPPEEVETLIEFALLKAQAQRLGVEAIDRRGGALNVKFHPNSKVEPQRLMALVGSVAGAQFTPAGVLRLPVPAQGERPAVMMAFVKGALEGLSAPAAISPAVEV
ncbi:MAG TPA: transcription-repair coupling factor [Bryobacteraceae bacterium]|nr:transcription-repair coupling factor [Bryobacteraceae bacterium]